MQVIYCKAKFIISRAFLMGIQWLILYFEIMMHTKTSFCKRIFALLNKFIYKCKMSMSDNKMQILLQVW